MTTAEGEAVGAACSLARLDSWLAKLFSSTSLRLIFEARPYIDGYGVGDGSAKYTRRRLTLSKPGQARFIYIERVARPQSRVSH